MPRTHTVTQGECLATIAAQYGFAKVEALYDDPANEALRGERKSPYVLRPGDVVHIPERTPKEVSAATGRRHRFQKKVLQTWVRIKLQTREGRGLANKRFALRVLGETIEGTLDGDGVLSTRVPVQAVEAKLTVFMREEESALGRWTTTLRIGHLDPVSEVHGVQARLKNLGIARVHLNGELDAGTRAALRLFQKLHDLEPTGELTEQTRQKLEEVHGS